MRMHDGMAIGHSEGTMLQYGTTRMVRVNLTPVRGALGHDAPPGVANPEAAQLTRHATKA
jgi:hypothetical protein